MAVGVDVQPSLRCFRVAFAPLRSNITIFAGRMSLTFSPRTTAHNSLAMSLTEKETVVANQEHEKEAVVADQEQEAVVAADQEQDAEADREQDAKPATP